MLFTNSVSGTAAGKLSWQFIPDSNYSIDQIIHSKLHLFQNQDTIRPSLYQKYWAQIRVLNPNQQGFYLSTNPNLKNTWFYKKDGIWQSTKTGLEVPNGRRDHYFEIPAHHNSDSVFYVLMDVSRLHKLSSFLPTFRIHNAKTTDEREWYITLFSAISIVILLLYILNIVVEYIMLRESTHIYYLAGLVGGLLYVLSYHSVVDLLLDFRFIKVIGATTNQVFTADFSYILNRISIMVIGFGIINLTTTFLNTEVNLPRWHKVLKYYLHLFLSTNLLSLLITLFTSFPSDIYFISISNIMLIISIVLIIISGVLCLKKDRKNAVLFLIAHLLPFGFIILTSVYVELNTFATIGHVMVPYLTILSVPIGLNTLLTLRVIHVKNTLHENKILAQQIEIDNERAKHENEVEKLEKENFKNQLELEKLTRENLELKVDIQNRQLLTSAMQIQKKDEIILNISQEVSKISKTETSASTSGWKAIKSLIQNHDTAESNWETFKAHFEKIHPGFFESLRIEHPELTTNEIRLSAYLKLNLTNKEIAVLQNIEPASVKRAKIRLKQKIEKTL